MRRPLLLALVLAVVTLGGCRVDATVEARITGAGGVVTARFVLDREAVALLGGSVGEGAQTSDLLATGWEITPVRPTADGGAEAQVSKHFSRPADLGVVLGELSGPQGPLGAFRLERRRSFTRKTYHLTGTADLASATGFANTPDLPARLRDAGVDPGRVEELLDSRAAEGFHLRLVVDLPGRAPETFDLRRGAPTTVDLASSTADRRRPALLGVAVLSGFIAVRRVRRRSSQT